MNYIGIRKRPVETRMYYCKSRYYVLDWCRWLNGDHISYLSLKNINDMNLFAYCYNGPVNFVDSSGCFPILTVILCGLALIGMGLTMGGMTIAAEIGGATLTCINGGVTVVAGVRTGKTKIFLMERNNVK